jgi:hypothetical protein
MKKLLPIIVLLFVAWIGWYQTQRPSDYAGVSVDTSSLTFDESRSGQQVEGSGTVLKVLPDDNKGSRHQKFILQLDSGQTVLVAHNVDLAPRIPDLESGDTVEFNGQFEWNDKGGVVHWTHHDPQGRHKWGFLKHEGEMYR